ncbi:MAG: hypothetical protein H6R07_375 [Proteobacteria bacterium]|nr:hypothetical protein [Pseudomonadota bacterium]
MCVNYLPVPKRILLDYFQTLPPIEDWHDEVWEDYTAPIIVADGPGRKSLLASYGMVPKKRLPPDKRFTTMNARAETIGQLPSYKRAWLQCQLCLVPMMGFFEPYYAVGSDKSERYMISLVNNDPFAVAGLWRSWSEEDGSLSYSFSQITINADDHPLMNQMHKTGVEKRSLVIVPKAYYDTWLDCHSTELARTFLQNYPAELMQAFPTPRKPPLPVTGSLF